MPSPTCTVADGAGSPQATTNGVDVTAANTVHIALTDIAVRTWSLAIVGYDDAWDPLGLSNPAPPTLAVDYTTKTATFTAPDGPWAFILQSQVNGGVDINGQAQDSYTTTFGVYCLGNGSMRLMAINERAEGSAAYGWITKVNALIRVLAAGGQKVASGLTSDATATAITYVDIPAQSNVIIEFYAVAKKVGAANVANFFKRQRVKRTSGVPSLWGTSPEAIGTDANGESWDTNFSISGNQVLCRIVGQAATNIQWTVDVKFVVTRDP